MTQSQCRICLENVHCTFNLSDNVKDRSIWEALNSIANVSVGVDDTFPQSVCCPCFDKLEQVIEYQIEVETNEQFLYDQNILGITFIKMEEEDVNGGIREEVFIEDCVFEQSMNNEIKTKNCSVKKENEPESEKQEIEPVDHRCCMCQTDFKTKLELESHIVALHSNIIEQNLQKKYTKVQNRQCVYCKQKFRLRRSLKMHVDNPNYKELPKDRTNEHLRRKLKLLIKSSSKDESKNRSVKKENESDLEEQEDESKNKTQNLRCCICQTDFQTKTELKSHVNSIHSDIIEENLQKTYKANETYKCVYCKRKFRMKRSIEMHVDDPNYKELPKDRTKEYAQRKIKRLVSEESTNKKIPVDTVKQIEEIERLLSAKESVKKSKKTVRKFRCCICQMGFKRKMELQSHTTSVHSDIIDQNIQKTYSKRHKRECLNCKKKFRFKISLELHVTDPNYEEPVIIHTKEYLMKKEKDLPCKNRPKEKVICTYCGIQLANRKHLEGHELRMHAKEFPFECPHPGCGKRFAGKRILKSHFKVHGEKKYICEVCTKSFVSKRQLMTHSYLHKEVKRFHCDLCPRTFTFKQILQRHVESHIQEKIFPCDQCEKTYKWDVDLQRHRQWAHEGKAPFSCKYCHKGYFASSSRTYHEQRCNLAFI